MSKKVSVIVNCHNGEKYLKKSIKSILNQSYKNFEIIFFDNFSSDNTRNIIFSFQDRRIRYFRSNKKLTLYQARNKALKKTTGSIIAFLDTDDWWSKNYLSSREKEFINKNNDFFYCNTYIFNQKKKKSRKYKNYNLPSGKIYNHLAKDYFIIISGLMFKKKILSQVGYFNNNLNIIGDFDFMMKVSKMFSGHATNRPLIYYRNHKNNFSKINTKMFYNEYKNWYLYQLKKKDEYFYKNISFFKMKLQTLELKHLLLNEIKTLALFIKIFKHPNFLIKIKYFLVFLIPKKIINLLQ